MGLGLDALDRDAPQVVGVTGTRQHLQSTSGPEQILIVNPDGGSVRLPLSDDHTIPRRGRVEDPHGTADVSTLREGGWVEVQIGILDEHHFSHERNGCLLEPDNQTRSWSALYHEGAARRHLPLLERFSRET